jgi:hypothetical protein
MLEMACPECKRLREIYEARRRVYNAARSVMIEASTAGSVSTFSSFKVLADDTRIDSELARLEMARHERHHAQAK